MRNLLLSFTVVTCSAVMPLFAQEVLGGASINGREIVIQDDFTWTYREEPLSGDLSDCFKVVDPYVFCGKELGWSVTTKLSPDAAASFRMDDRNYGAVIRESLGTNDGFSLDFMQQAMISNLATAAGLGEQDIPTYSVDDLELFDANARRVVYGAEISGLPVIYYNTVWLTDAETIQFFTFTIGKEPTPEALQTHMDAIEAMKQI